jgi:flagellar basal body-associated protein FliL
MEKIICILIVIIVLASMVYKVYRFFAKKEIITCYGERIRLTDQMEEKNAAQKKESKNIN